MKVLKPVNPRAQSRVPPPEDVDLDRVVNRSAFDKFLSFQVIRIRLRVYDIAIHDGIPVDGWMDG